MISLEALQGNSVGARIFHQGESGDSQWETIVETIMGLPGNSTVQEAHCVIDHLGVCRTDAGQILPFELAAVVDMLNCNILLCSLIHPIL